MNKAEIETKVKAMLAYKLMLDISLVTNESDLINDLGADDIDMVEICMETEKEFNIATPDEEWYEEINTVQELINLVARKIV